MFMCGYEAGVNGFYRQKTFSQSATPYSPYITMWNVYNYKYTFQFCIQFQYMKLHKKHRYWQKQIDKNKNIGSSKPGKEAGRGTRETGFASPPLGGCVRQLDVGALHEQVISTHNIFNVIFLDALASLGSMLKSE